MAQPSERLTDLREVVSSALHTRVLRRGQDLLLVLSSFFVAFVAFFVASPAHAQSLDDDVEVRVGGSRAAGFVSRATIEEAPREVTDAASLVEPLPGVHVRRLGADDAFATLSIRGSSSTQVAIFLAGVPLSGGADPTLDLATLPLWPGARASVHRTFAPAALGRGSLGGTLVLDPPSPRSPERTDVWAAVGSYGSRRMRVGNVTGEMGGGEPGGVRIASGVSASRADDDFSYLDPSAALAGHDVLATRHNAGHSAIAGLASVAIPVHVLGGTGAVTTTTLLQARRQELPGSARVPTNAQRLDSSRIVSALEWTFPAGSGAFGVRGWGRRDDLAIHDSPASASLTRSPWQTDDAIVAVGGSAGWRGRIGQEVRDVTEIELRLDGSAERFAPGTWLGATAPPGAHRTNGGLALDVSRGFFGALTTALSARADMWSDTSDDAAVASRSTFRPTGNVGIEVPAGAVLLASHAGFVARPPSFVERFGDRGAFFGDPNLKTESAFTVDAGARARERLGPVRLRAELTGFATWADDLITFVYFGAYSRARATNIGEARLYGLEGELAAEAFGFALRLSDTALATENDSRCSYAAVGVCTRPPLPGRPAQDFVGDLTFTHGPVRLRYGIDVVAGILVDDTGAVEVPARVLHGASVSLEVPHMRGLFGTLDVRNLFDLRAADYVGVRGASRGPIGDLYDYPLPGRRFLLGFRFTTDPGSKNVRP